MTDEKFWQLADKYEQSYNYHKGEEPFVLVKDAEDLAIEIIRTNNYDFDESLADFELFNFRGHEESALKKFNKAKRAMECWLTRTLEKKM